ncbi:MAG: ATP-binding protein [Planctomycetaceae bacterium]|nr:ATP-binding protein [Planctomycetaceae bacterium]
MFGRKVETPEFLETPTHVEALNRLLYLVESGTTMALIQGQTGSGRTVVLAKLKQILTRQQFSCPMVNVAGMDAETLFWHIASVFSLPAASQQNKAATLISIRDEILGRAHCGLKTLLILDDLDHGFGDFQGAIRYLAAVAAQTEGMFSIVMAASTLPTGGLIDDAELRVELPRLSRAESAAFAMKMLGALTENGQSLTQNALEEITSLAQGLPARLTQLCNVLHVVHETTPDLAIDEHIVRELALEVGLRSAA